MKRDGEREGEREKERDVEIGRKRVGERVKREKEIREMEKEREM